MRLSLLCSDNNKALLLELLKTRNLTVDDQASICLVEFGCTIPQDKVAIVFTLSYTNYLIELLDKLAKIHDEHTSSIVGRSAEERYEIIPYKDIYYFEARGNNVFCITVNHEYKIKEKLYELEGKLPHNRFIRISKSFIVNIKNIKEIIPWFGRRLVLKFVNSEKEVEVSKNYVKNFKEFLGM